MAQRTFSLTTTTGNVEGEAIHVAVTVTDGRVTLTSAAAPGTWSEQDYAAYEAAQAKKGK